MSAFGGAKGKGKGRAMDLDDEDPVILPYVTGLRDYCSKSNVYSTCRSAKMRKTR